MQTETTTRCYLTPVRMATVKKKKNKKTKQKTVTAGEDVEKLQPLCTVCQKVKWYRGFGKNMVVPQRIKNRITVRFSNSLLGIYSKELKAGS